MLTARGAWQRMQHIIPYSENKGYISNPRCSLSLVTQRCVAYHSGNDLPHMPSYRTAKSGPLHTRTPKTQLVQAERTWEPGAVFTSML